ncbi:MAG: acyltransferase [Solirubrobacterales bacterium]|nr:acyltransferase [Solirubrobacterales bacterium]MBV9915042.1 acyltransferase [Solirubrobacterales bacterium]
MVEADTPVAEGKAGAPARGRPALPSPGAIVQFLLQALFNLLITHLPGHWLRLLWLRLLGVRIGSGTIIFRGTTVFGARELQLGERVHVGFRVVLDARGGIRVGEDVNISSDVQLLTARHAVHSPEFEREVAPIVIEDHVWVATRAMVLAGVKAARGAVIAAGAIATRDVPELTVVAGVPATATGSRRSDLSYRLVARRPPLY